MNLREKYRKIINSHFCEFTGVKSTGNISIFADNLADELLDLLQPVTPEAPSEKAEINPNTPF